MGNSASVVTFDSIVQAAEALKGVAVRTPILTNPALDELAGAQLFLKVESLQLTGAFKFRGAYNAVTSLNGDQQAAGVVAFSSGNHAQAVARAATMCGVSSVIVMPTDTPEEKVASTKANGARVVFYDRYTEDRVAIAEKISAEEGRSIISPYDDPAVIAGQGTVGLEVFEQLGPLDAMAVCVGGGGLLSGCCIAAQQLAPATKFFGVEPEAGNDHGLSRAAGERVTIDVPRTIADGQQVSAPGELTWPITNKYATDFPTVSDDEIIATMKLLFEHTKLVVEPSGASALAAVLHRDLGVAGRRVGVTISGGNIGLDRFREIVG